MQALLSDTRKNSPAPLLKGSCRAVCVSSASDNVSVNVTNQKQSALSSDIPQPSLYFDQPGTVALDRLGLLSIP